MIVFCWTFMKNVNINICWIIIINKLVWNLDHFSEGVVVLNDVIVEKLLVVLIILTSTVLASVCRFDSLAVNQMYIVLQLLLKIQLN